MRASSLRRSTWLTTSAIRLGLALGSCCRSVKIARTCGPVTAGAFSPPAQPLGLQEPQGQQREGHMVVPTDPTAHLVVPQPDLLLALAQQLFHPMPRPVRLRHLAPLRLPGIAQRIPGPSPLLTTA